MKKALLFIATVILCITFSCSKKDDPSSINTNIGMISGLVILQNENSNKLTSFNNIKVTIANSELSDSIDTDIFGYFSFNNIPSGTYDITFTKEGFSTQKKLGITHLGGSQPTFIDNISLYEPSSTTVLAELKLDIDEISDKVHIAASTTSTQTIFENGREYVIFYFDNENNLSPTNHKYALIRTRSEYDDIQSLDNIFYQVDFTISVDFSTLENAGFKSGDEVFLVGYGGTDAPKSYYYDYSTKNIIYTDINQTPSDVVSFTFP